jgi:uroporphyrinogen-III synthase
VRRHGAAVAATAAEHRSEGLAAALGDVRGLKVLLSVAEKSRPELPRLLRRGGARVTVATAYRTLPVPGAKARLRSLCERQAADVVVFTSPSTAENLAALAGRRGLRRLFGKAKAASIGPVTSDALRKLGVEPAVQADPYTADGLVKALKRWAVGRGKDCFSCPRQPSPYPLPVRERRHKKLRSNRKFQVKIR